MHSRGTHTNIPSGSAMSSSGAGAMGSCGEYAEAGENARLAQRSPAEMCSSQASWVTVISSRQLSQSSRSQ